MERNIVRAFCSFSHTKKMKFKAFFLVWPHLWSTQANKILYGEFKNEQEKDIFFDLPEQEIESQIFTKFPAHDLNFHGRWGWQDQIKTSF